jgi:folate-dependent phosphoribosylglycinamide formyltransferase PurN
VLAGYLKKIPDNVVHYYSNKIVNIHPALLPAFGGKGMYGMHVHEAVFRSGAKISGVTVHLVNDVYDAGPIVMQRPVDIEACKNPEEIAKTVLVTEHQLFSEALQRLFTTDFRIDFNRVLFE